MMAHMEEIKMVDFEKGIVFEGDDSRIVKCMKRALNGEKIKVAFLGGSITQGCLASTPDKCYAYRTFVWWEKAFPEASVSYLNAGIGGTTSHLGVGRVQEDILAERPDFIIVEFSVNDPDAETHFQETYESLVRRILVAEWKPALMLVHNVRYDDGGNAQGIHRPVGAHYHLPSVSMKPSIYALVEEKKIDVRRITPDDLHPNDLGHEWVAGVIIHFLEKVKHRAAAVEIGSEDSFLPLPKPLTLSSYEQATRYRNYQIEPTENNGFQKDETPQQNISDCFKCGWQSRELGAKIAFEVEGANIAVQYRKTVRKPAPIATLYLDGDREHGVELDANFTETWGDCLYLETVLEHGTNGKHTVEIEITKTHEQDQESFYLVSLIVG